MKSDCLNFDEFRAIGAAGGASPRLQIEHLQSCKSCTRLLSELGFTDIGRPRRSPRFLRDCMNFASMGLVLPVIALVMVSYSKSKAGSQFASAVSLAKTESIDRIKADQGIEETVWRAETAGKSGEWKAAARYYSLALNQDPRNDVLRKAVAMAYMKSGNYDSAFDICRQAERKPEDLEYVFKIAAAGKTDSAKVRHLVAGWDLPALQNVAAAIDTTRWHIPWLCWGAIAAIVALAAPTLISAYLEPSEEEQTDQSTASAAGS